MADFLYLNLSLLHACKLEKKKGEFTHATFFFFSLIHSNVAFQGVTKKVKWISLAWNHASFVCTSKTLNQSKSAPQTCVSILLWIKGEGSSWWLIAQYTRFLYAFLMSHQAFTVWIHAVHLCRSNSASFFCGGLSATKKWVNHSLLNVGKGGKDEYFICVWNHD